MNHSTRGNEQSPRFRQITQAGTWIYRRRHAALSSALRGAAYASGTGIVGLIFWWIQAKS